MLKTLLYPCVSPTLGKIARKSVKIASFTRVLIIKLTCDVIFCLCKSIQYVKPPPPYFTTNGRQSIKITFFAKIVWVSGKIWGVFFAGVYLLTTLTIADGRRRWEFDMLHIPVKYVLWVLETISGILLTLLMPMEEWNFAVPLF